MMSSEKYKVPSEVKIYSNTAPAYMEEHKKYEYKSSGEVTKLTQMTGYTTPIGSDEPEPIFGDVTQYIYSDGRDSDDKWTRTMTARKTEESGQTVQTADIIDTYEYT